MKLDSVSLLQRLIAHPSVSCDPILDLANDLATLSEDVGCQVRRFQSSAVKQNIVAHVGPVTGQDIALSGHMDVVPVAGQNWDSDPFCAEIRGDRLYGRGSCDMKGFIAIVLSVLSKMNLSNLNRGITLVWTHDEEVGCVGAQSLVQQIQKSDLTLPKAMLIGEPTNANICHHHGGHTTIEIAVAGRAAHSSKPHLGLCANSWMAKCLAQVLEWQQWLTQQTCTISGMPPLVNIGEIVGGEAINIIPNRSLIRLGLRPMPSHDCNKILDNLYLRLKALQEEIANVGGEIRVTVPQHALPLYTKLPSSVEQAVRNIHPSAATLGVPFATDGGCFTQLGCEPIIWGPGSIDVAHQPNEWISLREIASYERQLHRLLHTWCL